MRGKNHREKKKSKGRVTQWQTNMKREHSKVWHAECQRCRKIPGASVEGSKKAASKAARAWTAELRQKAKHDGTDGTSGTDVDSARVFCSIFIPVEQRVGPFSLRFPMATSLPGSARMPHQYHDIQLRSELKSDINQLRTKERHQSAQN